MKYAHLVVGFPIYDYFRNAILSVIKNDKNQKSILIICLTGSGNDENKIINLIEKIKKKYSKRKIIVQQFCKKNKKSKVGILYKGNNFALEYCYNNSISILNIIQNDMQLMYWNKKITELSREIFKKKKSCLFLTTGFLRKPTHLNFYQQSHQTSNFWSDSIKKDYNLIINPSTIGDWGLYDIKKLKKMNFKFRTNENAISKYLNKKKFFRGFYFPLPFIGVIPWPAVVRNEKIYGNIIKSRKPLLAFKEKYFFLKLLQSNKIPFQEDYIYLKNICYLHPSIYTDFSFFSYLKLIFNTSFPYYQKNNKKKNILNLLNPFMTHPNVYNLLKIFIQKKFSRIKKYSQKVISI